MSWRDRILPASFRGVPFAVESAEGQGGRRTVVHEFPQRDDGFAEDLGKVQGRFSLTAFVVGDDYFDQRDALEAALNKPGPGTLVHPYRGTVEVQVAGPFRVQETAKDGRVAKYTIEFVQAGEVKQPAASVDTQTQVADAAAASEVSSKTFLERVHTVVGELDFVADSAADGVAVAADAMDAALAPVKGFAESVERLKLDIDNLRADAVTLVTSPSDLALRIFDAFDSFESSFDPDPLYDAMTNMFPFGSARIDPFGLTKSRKQQQINDRAIESLVRIGALTQAAQALSEIEFDSDEAALLKRDELIELITQEMEVAEDDVFSTLADLRASIVNDIALRIVDASRLVEQQFEFEMPSLVAAFGLYQDATRNEEIFLRNTAVTNHPGFIPEGIDISVLSNV